MTLLNTESILKELLYDPKNPLLFNNGFFVYFFFFFIILHYIFRNNFRVKSYIVSFFSLYFFYKASGSFVVLVIISAIVDYLVSNALYRVHDKAQKKLLLVISIFFNLGMLVYFKYTNFFIDLANGFTGGHIQPLNILLPVGISFYTFENLSYTIDVYRGEFKPEKNFINYLLFLSFFPKLVMGPIVRAADFIPQLHKPYQVSETDFTKGFYLIISGLIKKVIISDYITVNFVNYIFEDPSRYTGLECLMAVYAYAVVIYCDFSGYSDVALGIARWMGIRLPVNFLSPYQSQNITEFWRRWHISLSSWLRDYLYISLGGNRMGKIRTYLNLLLTMLLGGLWHGASLNFVFWGALHGAALAFHKVWIKLTGSNRKPQSNSRPIVRVLSVLLTFHFVCFCWIFFKASDFSIAQTMLQRIGSSWSWSYVNGFVGNYKTVLGMMILAFCLHAIPDSYADKMVARFKKAPMPAYIAVFLIFILLYSLFKSAEPVMPIYLQF
jgi:D-alanyl-lipoteichoic acid acyltransferase DltB (MBOAT superfamily)